MKFNKTYSHKRQDGVEWYGLPREYERIVIHHPGIEIKDVRAWIRDTLIDQVTGYHVVVNGTTNWQIADWENVVYGAATTEEQFNTGSIHVCVIPRNANYAHLSRLVSEIQRVVGKELEVVGHGDLMPTACPGDIDVKRIINAEESNVKVNRSQLNHLYRFYLGRGVTDYGKNVYQGKQTFDETVKGLKSSNTFNSLLKQAKDGKLDPKDHLPSDMRRVFKNPLESKVTELEKELDKMIDSHGKVLSDYDDAVDEIDRLRSAKPERKLNKVGEILEILIEKVGLK